uniref:Gluconate 5-dehydrogenase n=1 Tax=Candidatus Kentrum sp. MB TaxID=2138164 RepID=A0A451B9W5_9GAMM|nr:MAG: gluconate 5-dehydrogenase [Candidatus Kentron sp. MB]VFK27188.1 MAG: gluconate 5-dehydrogenase [Candidatus Kentron sp. MB]VFK75084.1 MAG: gluconate 5-dehydrogenase [Candidatus Kentron sp. MB]
MKQEMTVDSLFDLRGRNALVTGGSRGIGKAIAQVLLQAGAEVVITGRTQEALNVTQEEFFASFGKRIHTLSVDHAEWEKSEECVGKVAQLLKGNTVDILVNNAGGNLGKHLLEMLDDRSWSRTQALNLFAPMALTRAVTPAMKQKGWGRVLNIASYWGMFGAKKRATYVTSKGGLIGLTKALAVELGPFGITVNAIAPGAIKTKMTEANWRQPGSDHLPLPIGRWGEPEEIAGLALALVADTGSYITGQTICIDGGASAI